MSKRRFVAVAFLCLILGISKTAWAELRTEEVGGCLVIHVRDINGNGPDLNNFCSKLPAMFGSKKFQELYAWTPPILATAYDTAEKALSSEPGVPGFLTAISGGRHTRIIVIPGTENAFIVPTQQSLDIFITSQLINFAEGISGATTLDALKESGSRNIAGLGFKDWLYEVRNDIRLPNGNVAFPGPTSPQSPEWSFKFIQAPAVNIFYFVFGHELGHIKTGISSGGQGDDAFRRESNVDIYAFLKLNDYVARTPDKVVHGVLVPNLLVNWFVGMRYYDLLTETQFLNANFSVFQNNFILPGAAPLDERIPARVWTRRASALVDEWEKECKGNLRCTACGAGWQNGVIYARGILASQAPYDSATTDEVYRTALLKMLDAVRNNLNGITIAGTAEKIDDETISYDSSFKFPGAESTSVFISTANPADSYISCKLYQGDNLSVAESIYNKVLINIVTNKPSGMIGDEKVKNSPRRKTTTFTLSKNDDDPKIKVVYTKYLTDGTFSIFLHFEK